MDNTDYITPNEAALACVATSMKKSRLRLETLIINSIVGGVLFSAGGMLALFVQAEGPEFMVSNPLIVKFLQGAVFPIGLFYVIILGAELFNSNVMYYTVGVCRGAVSILDMAISLSVSWIFNLGANLFVCYIVCTLGATTTSDSYVKASIAIAEEKCGFSFAETMIKGIAGNFCVCLAIYLQLLAKPVHVKFIMTSLPIFTFVCCGFTNVIADMYLVPIGLFNGANVTVGRYIWRTLISGTLGNFLGGVIFAVVIPFYLHLITVERDRKLLNLPQFEVRDEQPELEMDSRVVRVPTARIDDVLDSEEEDNQSGSTYNEDKILDDQLNPVSYRPHTHPSPISHFKTNASVVSKTKRSPPGVFPVLGMGKPLARERTIANANDAADDVNEEAIDTHSIATGFHSRYEEEEEEFANEGGYNVREHKLGESLKRVLSRKPRTSSASNDLESGLRSFQSQPQGGRDPSMTRIHQTQTTTIADPAHSHTPDHPAATATANKLFKTISSSFRKSRPTNASELYDQLTKYNITTRAVHASDPIAGIANHHRGNFQVLHRPDLRTTREDSYQPSDSRLNTYADSGPSSRRGSKAGSRVGSRRGSRRGSALRTDEEKIEVKRALSQIDSAQNSDEDVNKLNIDSVFVQDNDEPVQPKMEAGNNEAISHDEVQEQDLDDLPSILSSVSVLSDEPDNGK